MLSAVAARKARLKEAKSLVEASSAPTPAVETSPTVSLTTSPSHSEKPPSKRRAIQRDPPSSTRKKVKRGKTKDTAAYQARTARSRYFSAANVSQIADPKDPFRADRGSDVSMDSDAEDVLPEFEPALTQLSLASQTWPPSQPPPDSSDEESSTDDGAVDADVHDLEQPAEHFAPRAEAPVILSTFQPVLDQNTFSLTADECAALGLSDDPALALVFASADTLALVGSCSLVVLYGCVSMLGAVLHPSRTAHRVFAPRSSPLPVMRAHGDSGAPKSTCVACPDRIRLHFSGIKTVVVLQELRTGVEGLGHVVRTFDDVFIPPRNLSSAVQLPISGVYMVCG